MQIVVVAVVVKENQILLLRRINKEPGLDWSCPSGKMEPGESEKQAVVREVLEETNCVISPLRKIGEMPHPFRSDMKLVYWNCNYVSGEARIVEPDLHESVGWKSFTEAKNLLERDWNPFVKEFFELLVQNTCN